MAHNHLIAGLIAVACLAAGCASNRATSRAESASVLTAASDVDDRGVPSFRQGKLASMYGDTETSILLFQRAVAENPTPLNKYNLAGAYRNAGRIGEALVTYDQVVKEGANSEALTLAPRTDRGQRNVKFNLAASARVGVQDMMRLARNVPTASTDDEKPEMTPEQAAAADRQVAP